ERGGVVTFLHEVTREREIEKLKSEFVSTAAHELRTPLSTILGFSELILNERDLPAEDLREYVGIIHQKAEGLALIVSDLLDISRIEAGDSLPLEPEQCDLKELCEDALLGFKVYGDKYTFELSLPETEISVKADRFAIAQVLENILSNAVKYSPEGSVITLEVDAQKEEAQICVADQGMGMFPEQVERVYDKFYRADASNTAIPGTGLGMTIVKHIVDAHGGKVWIDSAPQQGTRVYFTLPLS
ncbi:MAG: histidine kinase, partial [Desulfuromonas sp.]